VKECIANYVNDPRLGVFFRSRHDLEQKLVALRQRVGVLNA
jgi:hypothetical protein